MISFQKKSVLFRGISQAVIFSITAFIVFGAQALVTEPALYYSARIGGDIALQAEDPQELVETYNRYMKIRFDKCMSSEPRIDCVLLEINRESKASAFTNGRPNFFTWWTRQTNVPVHGDPSVNENGLNYFEAKLVVDCPYDVAPYVVSTESGADGAALSSVVCAFQEEIPDECAVEGNPVNFLSGDKVELAHDFYGRGGLTLKRRYINQRVGWQVEPLDSLFDLSLPKGTTAPDHVCAGYPYFRSQQRLDFSSSSNIQPVRFNRSFCLDFIGPDQAVGVHSVPDIIIKKDDGRIHEFYLENGIYRSAVPGLILKRISANSLEEPSWKLVDENGASKFFNSDGYLLSTQSADNHESLLYSYLNGRLHTKTNRYGDQLTFHYDQNQQVQRVSVPGSSEVHYQFHPAGSWASFFRLETVTYEDGQSIEYRYDDPRFPTAMTSLIDAIGQVFAGWTYDRQGRAVSSERGSRKEKFIFDFSDLVAQKVSVINPLGRRTTYSFETINGLQRITQVEGLDSPSCAARERYRSYYTTGALQSATDWEGNVTHLERDDLGRVIRKTQGLRWSGDPQYGVITSGLDLVDTENANVKETCWHHSLNQPERVIENARVTIYKYDTHGRVVSRKVENRTVENGQCL